MPYLFHIIFQPFDFEFRKVCQFHFLILSKCLYFIIDTLMNELQGYFIIILKVFRLYLHRIMAENILSLVTVLLDVNVRGNVG